MRTSLGFVASLLALGCFESGEPGWTPEDLAWPSEDLAAAEITPAGTAFIASAQGSVYRSTDAGRHFRRVHADPARPIHDLVFADAETGWAASDRHVLVTRDGGEAWHPVPLPDREGPGMLRVLAMAGPDHLIGVGTAGMRIRSEDGGRSWLDVSADWPPVMASEASSPADGLTLSCVLEDGVADEIQESSASEGPSLCLAGGASGGVSMSRDRGATWQTLRFAPPLGELGLVLGEGEVEWAVSQRQQLTAWAKEAQATSKIGLRIEAHVSAGEIERFAKQGDPDALFDIIEARLRDTREVLESAGLPSDRIETLGAPPFGYRDSLDDEPALSSRYFEEREAGDPGVTLSSVDLVRPVLASARERVTVGPAGQLHAGIEDPLRWSRAGALPRSERPIALLGCGGGLCWISEAGWMGVAPLNSDPSEARRVLPDTEVASGVPENGRLRDFAWAEEEGWGLLVGEAGQLLRGSTAAGEAGQRLRGSTSETVSLPAPQDPGGRAEARPDKEPHPPTGDAAHWTRIVGSQERP